MNYNEYKQLNIDFKVFDIVKLHLNNYLTLNLINIVDFSTNNKNIYVLMVIINKQLII